MPEQIVPQCPNCGAPAVGEKCRYCDVTFEKPKTSTSTERPKVVRGNARVGFGRSIDMSPGRFLG